MTEFPARAVAFTRDEELEAEVLVLAECSDGSGHRLELQRALIVTDEDRRLGLDTYALVNETGATHYGGIKAWSIDGELRLDLSGEAADALGVDDGYLIHLVDATAREAVTRGLRAILP